MSVVRNEISAIRTFSDVPNTSVFHRVARVVAKCLPIAIVVRIVSGLKCEKSMFEHGFVGGLSVTNARRPLITDLDTV